MDVVQTTEMFWKSKPKMIGCAPRHLQSPVMYCSMYFFFALQQLLFIIATQMEWPVQASYIRMNKILPHRSVNYVGLKNVHNKGTIDKKLQERQQKRQLIGSLLIYQFADRTGTHSVAYFQDSRVTRTSRLSDVGQGRKEESWRLMSWIKNKCLLSWKCGVRVKAM